MAIITIVLDSMTSKLVNYFQIRDMSKGLAPYEEPLGIDQIPARSCITYPWST